MPADHIADPLSSLVMGLPPDLAFRTQGARAVDISADALDDGLRLDFVSRR
jgi:hypothetical protein